MVKARPGKNTTLTRSDVYHESRRYQSLNRTFEAMGIPLLQDLDPLHLSHRLSSPAKSGWIAHDWIAQTRLHLFMEKN